MNDATAIITSEATVLNASTNGKEATQFGPGNSSARGVKRKGQGAGQKKPPRLLADMRQVYNHPGGDGGTPGQKMLRKLFEDNPKEFVGQLAQLERAYLSAVAKQARVEEKKAQQAGSGEIDEGT